MSGFAPEQLRNSTTEPARQIFSSDTKITNLAFDAGGNLWLVNLGKGQLERYAPESLSSTTPTPEQIIQNLPSPTDAAFDRMGNLWIANANGTLLKFGHDQLKDAEQTLNPNDAILSLELEPLIVSLAFDSAGNLWYTANATVLTLNAEELEHGKAIPEKFFQAELPIYSLAFDATGNLWLATWTGPLKFAQHELNRNPRADQHPPEPQLVLSGMGHLFDLAFDEQDNLWMTSFSGSVMRLNAATLSNAGNFAALPDIILSGTILSNTDAYWGGLAFWPIPPQLPLGKGSR